MKKICVCAKNVQKAIEQGLKELGVSQEDVDIKILDEGGLFRKAKVELVLENAVENEEIEEIKTEESKKETKAKEKETKKVQKEKIKNEKKIEETKTEEIKNDITETALKFLKSLFEKMNVEAEISQRKTENGICFNALGEKVSTLIGKRGETLNAIQEILSNVVKNAGFREERVYFDVENYKVRRETSLANLADRMAKKAIKIEKPIKLERMSAYERKIIHTALQNYEGITTKSEGEEPNRFLIIIPTQKQKDNQ